MSEERGTWEEQSATRREKRLLETSGGEESAALRIELQRLDDHLAEAERVLQEAKVAIHAASDAYEEARIEWRIRAVPEGRRDEARALLQEGERIAALYEVTPVPGNLYGAAAMEAIRMSALLSKARRAGDREGAARYEADLAAAREKFTSLQSALNQHRQAQKDLMDEYERRLRMFKDVERRHPTYSSPPVQTIWRLRGVGYAATGKSQVRREGND